MAAYAGIETATVAESAQLFATLARHPAAQLEYISSADIWAFRVRVRTGRRRSLYIGNPASEMPAGVFATYGTAVRREVTLSGTITPHDPKRSAKRIGASGSFR